MSTKIGRFEIVSELAKSASGAVYKANDPDAGRTIALKTIRPELPADLNHVLEELILQEADSAKVLNSQNIAQLYGAGEIDGQFCAAMEYVEGNSLANMIARQEGFSIWDLLDISRQVCLAIDHAHSHGVLHRALEPAKIMMQWDGTVKVLGYGTATMVSSFPRKDKAVAPIFHYMSPEQLNGDDMDIRSNIFTWGAILYEMITDRKAFEGEDISTLHQKILTETPEPPATINPRMNLGVSRVIMRALEKSPDERYQTGQELLNDLEQAKQTSQAAAAKQLSDNSRGLVIPEKIKASGPAKTGPSAPKPVRTEPAEATRTQPAEKSAPPTPAKTAAKLGSDASALSSKTTDKFPGAPETIPATAPAKKAAAAAAGASGSIDATSKTSTSETTSTREKSKTDSATAKPAAPAAKTFSVPKMSAATAEPLATEEYGFAVDPMMAEPGEGSSKRSSFSDLEEMPPLKEIVVTPPPPPPLETVVLDTTAHKLPNLRRSVEPEKPKVITRENAKKAVKEIKSVPPKLVMYAVGGAIALILIVVIAIALHIHSQNADEDTAAKAAPATQEAPPPVESQPAVAPRQVEVPKEEAPAREVTVKPHYPSVKTRKAPPVSPRPSVAPGELAINSTPEGAQIRMDGRSDPNWVTPYTMAGLDPGHHSVTVSKTGYSPESRALDVTSGSKSFLVIHLAQIGANIAVASEPAGANVYIDGKDTGHVTPAQITTDKGTHTFLVRKQGYLDETTTAELVAGQTFRFAPVLRAMGMTDDIKTVGKFGKFFRGDSGASMGKISAKTQPKGAQVTANRRMVDKPTPVDFMLNPGNYIIDITMSGYKPIHKVINVEKGSKLEIDETLQPE